MSFQDTPISRPYQSFCQIRDKSLENGIIDLSSETWFYPTKLMPLAIFIADSGLKVIPPTSYFPNLYYGLITKTSYNSFGGSYLPIVKIPKGKGKDKILHYFEDIDIKGGIGGKNGLKFIISELTDNVNEHSEFSTAYIMAQLYPKMGFLEICIVDNGLSIPRSFENAGYDFSSDGMALSKAINGLSTKDENERGYGLENCLSVITKAFTGSCLIVTRKGAFSSHSPKIVYKLSEFLRFNGTLISTRIPYQSAEVDIYGYLGGR